MDFELGKTYDELHIGEEASFTKTITETDVKEVFGKMP